MSKTVLTRKRAGRWTGKANRI